MGTNLHSELQACMVSTRGMSPQSVLEVVMVPRTKLANLEVVARETDG